MILELALGVAIGAGVYFVYQRAKYLENNNHPEPYVAPAKENTPSIENVLFDVNKRMRVEVNYDDISLFESVIDKLINIDTLRVGSDSSAEKVYQFKKLCVEDLPDFVDKFIKVKGQNPEFTNKIKMIDVYADSFIDSINSKNMNEFNNSKDFIEIRL